MKKFLEVGSGGGFSKDASGWRISDGQATGYVDDFKPKGGIGAGHYNDNMG